VKGTQTHEFSRKVIDLSLSYHSCSSCLDLNNIVHHVDDDQADRTEQLCKGVVSQSGPTNAGPGDDVPRPTQGGGGRTSIRVS